MVVVGNNSEYDDLGEQEGLTFIEESFASHRCTGGKFGSDQLGFYCSFTS